MLYENFQRAVNKGKAVKEGIRLIKYLLRNKGTDKENFLWAEQIISSYKLRFGEPPESLSEWVSLLALANDTVGAIGGDNKYAKCSSFEYSFYSFRKHRKMKTPSEKYAHEFPMGLLDHLAVEVSLEDGWIDAIYLTAEILPWYDKESLSLFVERYIRESSVREIEKSLGVPKSTVARKISRLDKQLSKTLGGYL